MASEIQRLEERTLLSGLSLTVDTRQDVVDATAADIAAGNFGSDGKLSLREAVLAANENAGSTIFLPSGTFNLTRSGVDDTGLAGDLDIQSNVTIFGDIAGGTVIDASAVNDRVFHVLTDDTASLTSTFALTVDEAPATLGTKLNDLDSIRTPFGAGDIVAISGTRADGTAFATNWIPGANATVGDLLARLNSQLGVVARASFDLDGNIVLALTTAGNSHDLSLSIEAASSETFRVFPAFGTNTPPKVDLSFLTLQGGNAARGGGLLNEGGEVDLFETIVTGNQAAIEGPGYFNDGGLVRLMNSPLRDNALGGATNTDPLAGDLANLLWEHRTDVVEAVDEFLVTLSLELEQNFRNALGQINIPVLGTRLQEAFEPILDAFADTRTTISDFLQAIINIPEPPSDVSFTELIQGALFVALGEGPAGLSDLQDDVENALGSFGLDVQTVGLGLLNDGPDSDAVASPTDILVTMGDDVEGTRWLEFGFHLGQRLVFDTPGFSIDGAISDLLNPDSIGLSETGSTILSGIGIGASSGGLRFDIKWDARLGFGVSERVGRNTGSGVYLRSGTTFSGLPDGEQSPELRFVVDAYATPTGEATGFVNQFEDIVTTPNWQTTLSLGVLQGRISDGTPPEIKITAPTGLPLSLFGNLNLDRFDFGSLSPLALDFGDADTLKFVIQTDLAGYESRTIEIDVSGGLGFGELMLRLNAEVIAAYGTPLPPVSFALDFSPIDAFFNPGALTTPFLVLRARDPRINTLTIAPTADVNGDSILGPSALGFVTGQHEDRRVRGMGFGNNSFSTSDGSGNQILEGVLPAPASGVSTADPDFYVHIGGARTTADGLEFTSNPDASIRIFWQEVLNREIVTLEQLRDKLNEVLRAGLIANGIDPGAVRFEIFDGDKLRLVAVDPNPSDANVSAPLITVTYAAVDQSRFTFTAAVDITDPEFNLSYFNDYYTDQRNLNRVTIDAIRDAASEGTLLEVFKPTLTAVGKLRLHVTTDPDDLATTNPDSSPFQNTFLSEVAMTLPNVEFDIVADIKLDGVDIIQKKRAGEAVSFTDVFQIPTLKFDNIQLDIADFLENVIVPIAQTIAEALEPFLEVIGDSPNDTSAIFNQPIPVISELLGRNVTLREILGEDVEQWVSDFTDNIREVAELGDKIVEFLQSDEFTEAMGGLDKFNFGGLEFIMDPKSPFYFPRTKIPIPTDLQFVTGIGEVGVGSFMRSFVAFDTFTPAGFSVDLFRPEAIFDMLTGNPFNIVSFGLPRIDLEAGAEFGFKFENLEFDIEAAASFDSNLRLVYDSLGLERIVDASRSGAEVDWADLLDGLAIQNNPEGFEFGGSVSFIGSGDITIRETDPVTGTTIVVFSGAGSIDLGASLGLELRDPNNDGKLRLDEILSITDGFSDPQDLLCIIDIQGDAHAAGSITIVAGGVEVFNEDFSAATGEFSLQSLLTSLFGTCVEETTPVLAETVTIDGETVLRMNTGAFAGNRLRGDVTDGADAVREILVNADGTVDLVEPNGTTTRFDMPGSDGKRLPLKEGVLPVNGDGLTAEAFLLSSGGVEFRDTDGTVLEQYAAPSADSKYFRIDGGGNLDTDVFLRAIGSGFEKWEIDRTSLLYLTGNDGGFELRLEGTVFSNSVTTFNADNQILEVTDWLGAKVIYEYGANGRLVAVTQQDRQGDVVLRTSYFHGVEGLFVETAGNEIKVWGFGVSEENAQTFDASAIDRILAYGSAFDDLFEFSRVTGTPVEIVGLAGNDTMFGGGAGDLIDGGAGDDTIAGNGGDDTLLAGSGNNTVTDGDGNDFVDLRRNDVGVTYTTGGGDDTVLGTRFNDTITATSGNVRFEGRFGDDTLIGAGGNDELVGGFGNDTLQGHGGNDLLMGESGNDFLEGCAGDDILEGGHDDDTLTGGSGADAIYGEAGNDVLTAGLTDSWVEGGTGLDHLEFLVDEHTHEGMLDAFAYTETGGVRVPYFTVETLEVTLGDSENDTQIYQLTIDGPILPLLNVTGGTGNDVVIVKNLPPVLDPPLSANDLETLVSLCAGDDTITVLNSGRKLLIDAGTSVADGGGDTLIVDRQADFMPRSGTLSEKEISGLGIANVHYTGFDFLELLLGSGDDRLTITGTNATTESLIQLGPGADVARVEGISSGKDTIINGNREEIESNNDAGIDTIQVVIAGDPNDLTENSFQSLKFSTDRLHIDNSQNAVANADWKFDEGEIYVGDVNIIDTLGAGVTVFTGGGGTDDTLTVQDDVETPQFVLVNDRLVRIDEGENVLSYLSSSRFNDFTYDSVIDGLDGVTDLAVSDDGQFIYAVGKFDDAITVFRRTDDGNPATNDHNLEFVQVLKDGEFGVDGLNGAAAVVISPDGKFVYVGSADDNAVAVFSRVEETGRLVYRGKYQDSQAVTHLAMGPDGTDLYGTNTRSVFRLVRNTSTGMLSFGERRTGGVTSDYTAIAVDPQGTDVFTSAAGIQQWHLASDGALPTSATDAVIYSGYAYADLAVGSGNTFYAVYNGGLDFYSYTTTGMTLEETHWVDNSVNRADGISVAVDPDGNRVVTSFDETSVDPTPSVRKLRLNSLTVVNENDLDGDDDIYMRANGSIIASFTLDEGQSTTLSDNYDRTFTGNVTIEVRVDGLVDEQVGGLFTIETSRANGTYGVNFIDVVPVIGTETTKYHLSYTIYTETPPTPSIDPLAIFTRGSSGGLTFNDYVEVSGASWLDALGINPVNEDIYGAHTAGDRITISTPNYFGDVKDGAAQSNTDLDPAGAGDVQIAISADGAHGYALSAKFGVIAVYDGNFSALKDHTVYGGFAIGSDLAVTPITNGSQMVYATNPAEDSLYVYSRNITTGALTLEQVLTDGLAGVNGLEGASDVIVTSNNNFVHVAGAGEDAVATFAIESDGTLSYVGTYTTGLDNPSSLTFANGANDFVYVTSQGNDRLLVLQQSTSGALSLVQTFSHQDLRGPVASVLAGTGGASLYVASQDGDAILVYSRNASTGGLTLQQVLREGDAGVHGIDEISALAASGDGQFIFATGDGTAAIFRRDPATGELTIVQRLRDNSGGVDGLERVTDLLVRGNTLYVGNGGADVGGGGVTLLEIAQDIRPPESYIIEYEAMEHLTVKTATEGDTVDVENVAIPFVLETGDGPDIVLLRNTSPDTTVKTGDGGNVIDVLTTTAGSTTTIHAGAGDDEINIHATAANSNFTAHGENGNDVYTVKGGRLESDVTIHGNAHPAGDTLRFDTHGFTPSDFTPAPGSGELYINDPAFTGPSGRVNYNTIEFFEIIASPLANAGGPYNINEGGSLNLSASGTSIPAGHSVVSYQWGIGDSFGDVTGETASLSWSDLQALGIIDDGTFTIWVTVTSMLGGELFTDTAATTLTIANVAPALSINGQGDVEAGATYIVNLSASDPGDDTIQQWVINWGDGTTETYGGSAPTLTHFYEFPGDYAISVSAIDDDGAAGPVTKTISVLPSRNISGDPTGAEGTPYLLSLNNPAGAAIRAWTIHWGDGQVQTVFMPTPFPVATWPVTHIYQDEGAYQIRVETRDWDTTTRDNIDPLNILIENVAPTIIDLAAPPSVDQGANWIVDVTATDPGMTDTLTYDFDFNGDGLFEVSSSDNRVNHVFTVPGEKTVNVRVRDNDGGNSSIVTLTLIVNNVAPTIDSLVLLTQDVFEATPIHIEALASDPGGADDPLTYAFDFNNDGVYESTGPTAIGRHVYDDDGTYEVRVLVTDQSGATAEATIEINVANLAPSINPPFTSQPVEEGRLFTITVNAEDPAGENDPLTYWFDFDNDGTYDASSATGTITHTFDDDSTPPPAEDGIYTVGIRVTDGDGSETLTTLDVEVQNVPPVIAVSGPSEAQEGEVYTLNLGAVTDPGDDTVTQYIVRWGDGTEDIYTTGGDVTHVYENTVGHKTIRALLVDEDGTHPLAASYEVLVTGVAIEDGTLFIVGGDGDDHVTIHNKGKSTLRVHADFFPGKRGREFRDYDLADFDRVVMYLEGGDDRATIAGNVDLPFIINGGSGDDHLHGGHAPSVLVGAEGDDRLHGGHGQNMIIGGAGGDSISGGSWWNRDLLIAGQTIYDDEFLDWRALDALFSEWTSDRPIELRVANIRNGEGPELDVSGARLAVGETVFGDCDHDWVNGDLFDWIFADLANDHAWTSRILFDHLQDSDCDKDDCEDADRDSRDHDDDDKKREGWNDRHDDDDERDRNDNEDDEDEDRHGRSRHGHEHSRKGEKNSHRGWRNGDD